MKAADSEPPSVAKAEAGRASVRYALRDKLCASSKPASVTVTDPSTQQVSFQIHFENSIARGHIATFLVLVQEYVSVYHLMGDLSLRTT